VTQFQWLVSVLGMRVHREQNAAIPFLREENRLLKAQLHGGLVRLRDHERRRLAAIGHRLGRRTLTGVATIAAPDTILRWYRELVIGQRTYAGRRHGRPGVHVHIRSLIVRMASENATWATREFSGGAEQIGPRTRRTDFRFPAASMEIPLPTARYLSATTTDTRATSNPWEGTRRHGMGFQFRITVIGD
jgi:hypothetical protein